MDQESNLVTVRISYDTQDERNLQKEYKAAYNPDTGVQQYLDYYEAGFFHDHPHAISMEIESIEAYHNDNPGSVYSIYESQGDHKRSVDDVVKKDN
ncbi:MAG: hypothetical protein ABJA70_12805 [Chryseolinea sp.]